MTSHDASERYHQLNSKLSAEIFDGKYILRAYQNASFAIYDIAMGLQQYLSHKNHLGLVKNGSSLIEGLTPFWLRQGLPLQLKLESQSWFEFIETLNSETNFVVWSSENEITGEVIVSEKECLEIHERLSKKRIFSIQVTEQLITSLTLPNYAVIILRKSILNDDACLVVMSEKMKALSVIGSYQSLDFARLFSQAAAQLNSTTDLKQLEKNLEQKSLYYVHYAMVPARLSDRVVFNFKDISGAALKEDLGLNDRLAFAPSQCPFWILQSWKNWWKEAESEALIRGLCIVSLEAFKNDAQLPDRIKASVDKIRRLSQWNVLS